MDTVRYEDLLPHQFRLRLAECPVAYLPLGTLEWHGEHLPLGSDAIISHGLMIKAAEKLGGIVMPPIYVGPDRSQLQLNGSQLQGMDTADVTTPHRQLDGSCYWVSEGLFMSLIDNIIEQLKRAGFKVVFADGHGPSRNSWVNHLIEREVRFGLKLLGVTKDFRQSWQSQMDHAAENETSLVMALRPDLVDLSQLPEDKSVWPQGVGGSDPRQANAIAGQSYLKSSIETLRQALNEVSY
ncbi:creatininase family protein [Candidatus Poribacteria bacterium]|nr:creatininase family protein [Candidatus Poribacteria bacterium]|tara:strand:+ start:447 stop:1163 length:717 start_codon:yes stop_codon:yes gene_type:complete